MSESPMKAALDIAFYPDGYDAKGAQHKGYLVLGDFRESFYSALGYWDVARYERHWREAAHRILNADFSMFITSMSDPADSGFITTWPMRKRGKHISIINRLFIADQLPQSVRSDIEQQLENYVETTTKWSDSNTDISKWQIPLAAMESFLMRKS
jgi:hypothetical protein